jgi:fructose-bisphosphate aldolase class 1
MDQSIPTGDKRFVRLGTPQAEEARRDYRELIVTTHGLAENISGAILYDETIRQQKKDGTPLIKVLIDTGIILGVKVDTRAKNMTGHLGERITEGLGKEPRSAARRSLDMSLVRGNAGHFTCYCRSARVNTGAKRAVKQWQSAR